MCILAAPARAQYTDNFQTNIISSVTSNWSSDYLVGSNTFADVLLIQAGGVLTNWHGWIGYGTRSSNNCVVVTDPNSMWFQSTNGVGGGSSLVIGNYGSGNSLVISNGGGVAGSYYYNSAESPTSYFVGYNATSSNNAVLISGAGSTWSIPGFLYFGGSGASNNLMISAGGSLLGVRCYLGYHAASACRLRL